MKQFSHHSWATAHVQDVSCLLHVNFGYVLYYLVRVIETSNLDEIVINCCVLIIYRIVSLYWTTKIVSETSQVIFILDTSLFVSFRIKINR